MKAYVSELFRNSIKSKSVVDFVYLVMMDLSMKCIYIISIGLFIVFLILLYKIILKNSTQVVESFSTDNPISYTLDYSTDCISPYNQIDTKLKVVLNNSNYHILHDKIDEFNNNPNPDIEQSTLSNCDKLKEILCDTNYTKIKHFINIGHHDGNNVWRDIAQSNADNNCTSTTFNSNIICSNLTHLLDNFHVIKSGIIDCIPCDNRTYRNYNLYCSNCIPCGSLEIINTSNVDISTRFYNDVGGGSACLPCGDSEIPFDNIMCSNCPTGYKPNTDGNSCVLCADSDYAPYTDCAQWACDTPRPIVVKDRNTNAPSSCLETRTFGCMTDCIRTPINVQTINPAIDFSESVFVGTIGTIGTNLSFW